MPGVVVAAEGGGFAVNVQGGVPPAKWPAGYIPTLGDPVDVLMVDGSARVLGPVIAGPRPSRGVVADAPSSGTVLLDTDAGQVRAQYAGTAPVIGTVVFLDWQATTARLFSPEAAAVVPAAGPTPGPAVPPPPPVSSSGTLSVAALDSASFNTRYGTWSSFYGTQVIQGSYGGGGQIRGAWFYGDAPAQVRGRTVVGLQIRLGARRRMGDYNSPLTLNLYLHTARTRPGGDVTRTLGPAAVVLAPSAGAQWVDLPAAWGQALADSGGGIGVAGGSYGGVNGIGDDPASGQLALDWTL